MAAKQVIVGEDSRKAILRGVNVLAASLMLTTEALVTEISEEKLPVAPAPPGEGMY